MAFQKGKSGNPGGRPKQRKFREALSLALSENDPKTGQPKLRRIADKLVEAAMQGESWAIREVADRTDGKAVQAVELESDHKQHIDEYSDEELLAVIAKSGDETERNGVNADGTKPRKANVLSVQNNGRLKVKDY